jgi:hypothetical protein
MLFWQKHFPPVWKSLPVYPRHTDLIDGPDFSEVPLIFGSFRMQDSFLAYELYYPHVSSSYAAVHARGLGEEDLKLVIH